MTIIKRWIRLRLAKGKKKKTYQEKKKNSLREKKNPAGNTFKTGEGGKNFQSGDFSSRAPSVGLKRRGSRGTGAISRMRLQQKEFLQDRPEVIMIRENRERV